MQNCYNEVDGTFYDVIENDKFVKSLDETAL